MICKNCNQAIDDNANFCPNCGAPQRVPAEQQLSSDMSPNLAGEASPTLEPTPASDVPPAPISGIPPTPASGIPLISGQQPASEQTSMHQVCSKNEGQASQGGYYYQQEPNDRISNAASNNAASNNAASNNAASNNAERINATPYLIFAIITAILCCLPVGIPAVMFASRINSAQRAGQMDVARIFAKKAKMFTIISVALGVVIWTFILVIFIVYSVATYYYY